MSEAEEAEAIRVVSLEQYLEVERNGDQRHELVGGRAYAMAGGTERHELMTDAVYSRWRAGAFGAGCRAFAGRMLRVPSGSVYYPDVMVVCSKPPDELYENDAVIVVEVTSPSTRGLDRREKLAAYEQLPSIRSYAIVDPVFRRIEVASWPDGQLSWTALGSGQVLASPYGDIDVDHLYDEVDAIAAT
ncbi:MAG: Uma2 family endonuclease [Chloroflexi bacterium]|nr:Uma2 family endonuclease [Chloroflexota bacterium]